MKPLDLLHGASAAGLTRADELLSGFSTESVFYFGSATQTLRGDARHVVERVHAVLDDAAAAGLQRELVARSEASGVRHVLGAAIPFDTREPAPCWLLRDPRLGPAFSGHSASAPTQSVAARARGYRVDFAACPADYARSVELALARIEAHEFEKVVLARSTTIHFDEGVERASLLRALASQNRRGFMFGIDVEQSDEARRTLLGASPELLVEKRGDSVRMKPLAGSRPRGRTREQDEQLAQALLVSEKDRREHALVIDAVVAALAPFCKRMVVPDGPSLSATPTMWHLGTEIQGELLDPGCSSLRLALALHPTPAVCGFPREAAARAIGELEDFARGLFAGAVGYCDAQGDGEWAVTLRCAEVSGQSVRMCAGAGIVAGSEPWSEVEETGAKLGTVLRALGLERAGGVS